MYYLRSSVVWDLYYLNLFYLVHTSVGNLLRILLCDCLTVNILSSTGLSGPCSTLLIAVSWQGMTLRRVLTGEDICTCTAIV